MTIPNGVLSKLMEGPEWLDLFSPTPPPALSVGALLNGQGFRGWHLCQGFPEAENQLCLEKA